MTSFVLVHSPSVGPATWAGVAGRLRASGHDVALPSLFGVADGEPPYWPRVVAAVNAACPGSRLASRPCWWRIATRGVFMPVIRAGLGVPAGCSVFADATVPAEHGETPVAPQEFLEFLRGLACPGGLLPQWTDWWDEQNVAPMFEGAERLRAAVTAGQPRLPLDYYTERVPVPGGWDDHRCGTWCSASRTRPGHRRRAGAAGRFARCPAGTCIRSWIPRPSRRRSSIWLVSRSPSG